MPLTFDKPLSELHDYQGTNPRPADFDAYWAHALGEMRALDPSVELRPNRTLIAGTADCYDLSFTGVGGGRIHAKYLRPKTPGRHPAVLQFHGYGGDSGDWFNKLAYAAEGFCVAALDCRGQGGTSEDVGRVMGTTLRGQIIRGLGEPDPTKLLFRQIFLDTAQLARIVMAFPEVDSDRVGAAGRSQGGGLALICAALEPRIRLASSMFPFLCDYQRVWEIDQGNHAYEELRMYFRMFDPCHEREREIFTKLGYIDVQHFAARIQAQVLMFTALMDTVCPPSTQFAAYNKITAPKRMVLYPDYGHEDLPGQSDVVFSFLRRLLE